MRSLVAVASFLLVAAAKPNVVLITIDTLRADHVHSYGYFRETTPNIDRFAADALLFERAMAPMASTLPTHVSIMTSSYPVRHGVLSNLRFFEQPLVTRDDLQTIAQMLRAAGYRTAGFTSASPLAAETGINAGFETFRGPPPYSARQDRIEWIAGETVEAATKWLAETRSPFFLWVHLFDPHHPYAPPSPFDEAFSNEPELFRFLELRGFPVESIERSAQESNLYDGEILYTDEQVGRLLGRLKSLGLYDEAIIVLTADHGEGLMQHNMLRHGGLWNEQVLVPLILRFPGGPRGRSPSLASLIDIAPTLAEHAGLPLDADQFDGINLIGRRRGTALSQRAVREDRARRGYSLTGREWKYVTLTPGGDRLYDLKRDPHEMADVIEAHLAVAATMKAELLRLIGKSRARSGLELKEEIPEQLREQLRELGYIE